MATAVEMGEALLREMESVDWSAVAEIYRDGIATGHATFETTVPSWEEWDAGRLATCRVVAEVDGRIAGFAALSPVSGRRVYRGVCEVTVYVASAARGVGLGRRILVELVDRSEREGIWTLQASIFPENRASIALHARVGFRVVGVRERLGRFRDGTWRDVTLMERRSDRAGIG